MQCSTVPHQIAQVSSFDKIFRRLHVNCPGWPKTLRESSGTKFKPDLS